jgi:four helix bundle protein
MTPGGKPYDLQQRLLLFACDVVKAGQHLHAGGSVGRALCSQLLHSATSVGANYAESQGASSRADFLAKNRIALKEAKETRFRLQVCRRCRLIDANFDALLQESDELVRILGKLVHRTRRTPQEGSILPRRHREG